MVQQIWLRDRQKNKKIIFQDKDFLLDIGFFGSVLITKITANTDNNNRLKKNIISEQLIDANAVVRGK